MLDKTILADYTIVVINMAEAKASECLDKSADVVMQAARPLTIVNLSRDREMTNAMVNSLTFRKPNPLEVNIGYTVPYAYWVEVGTGPHTIRIRNKKIMYNKLQDEFYGTEVLHPGSRPKPSLVPALEMSKPEIKRIFDAAG